MRKKTGEVKWWFPTILCCMFLVVPFLVPFRSVPFCWFVPSFIVVHSYCVVGLLYPFVPSGISGTNLTKPSEYTYSSVL
jgi:hypothetical protein